MAFSDIISGSAAASAIQVPVQALGGIVIDEHGKFSNLPIKLASDDSGVPTAAESAFMLSSSFSGSKGGATIIGALNFLKASISANLDAGGNTTEVQFNDSGVLAGDSAFTFNKTTDTLTVTKIGAFTAAGAIEFNNENMTNVDIDSGAIDGTNIGQSTPANATFLALTANNSLTVNAGASIVGDTTDEITLAVKGVGSQTANLLTVEQSDGTDKLAVSAAGVTTAASLVATTADINAGTIDNTVIGGTTTAAGTFTDLVANDSLTVNAGASIVGDTTDEITLAVKGVGSQTANLLTVEQSDGTDKLTVSAAGVTTAASLVATTADINAGTIDNAVIGGTTAAAATVTTLSVSDGNITNVADIALDTISADDGSSFSFGSNWTAAGRTCANLGTVSAATSITSTEFVGPIDGIVGGSTPAAGTFTTVTVNDLLDVNAGATITGDTTSEVTLKVTGVASQTADLLQVLDSDGNEDLSVDKDGVTTLRSLIATTADIDAGSIDNTVIGGTTAAAGSFTTLQGQGLLLTNNAAVDGEITGSASAVISQAASMGNGPKVDASDADMTTGSFGAALRVNGMLLGTANDGSTLIATGSAADKLGINQIPHIMFMGVDDAGLLQNYRLQVSGGMLQVNEVPNNVTV